MPKKRFEVTLTQDEMIRAVVEYIQRTRETPPWFRGTIDYRPVAQDDSQVRFIFSKEEKDNER